MVSTEDDFTAVDGEGPVSEFEANFGARASVSPKMGYQSKIPRLFISMPMFTCDDAKLM